MTKDITREALLTLRGIYSTWLTLLLATDAEKELAKVKIQVIDLALQELDETP